METAFTGLILDPRIRDWVLLPIFVVMILQGLLRQYVTVLWLQDHKPVTPASVEQASTLRRSQILRSNGHFLPAPAFRMRKRYLLEKVFRAVSQPKEGEASAPNPFSDPFAMTGMLKNHMAMVVPSMLMMGWVGYFFNGFVLVRLPFALGENFKSMLQRGIQLHSLDVSYVSSISWYFLMLFGTRGLFTLILGNDNNAVDSTKRMEEQMAGGMQQQSIQQLYSTERTELEIVEHQWGIPSAEYRLIAEVPPNTKYS